MSDEINQINTASCDLSSMSVGSWEVLPSARTSRHRKVETVESDRKSFC